MQTVSTLTIKPFSTGQQLQQQTRQCRCRVPVQSQALFGWGTKQERAAERDEQWEAQQHILKRRRGNLWQDDVNARRAEVRKYQTNPAYKKQVDDERRAKKKAEKEAAGGDPKWGIIIPIAPFGMPEYDGGERFDLRLPHVDNGWVDEDAAFGKTMARIFGRQKKEDKDAMNGKPGNALKGKKGKGKK